MGALVIFLIGLWIGWRLNGWPDDASTLGGLISKIRSLTADSQTAVLDEVWATIKSEYVDQPIKDSPLVEGAVKGLVEGLGDPYSIYLSPADTQEFKNEIQGTFEGIGAEIGIKREQLTVIAPLPGSPSERAGLQGGDIILEIDGQSTSGVSLDEAVRRLRGAEGTVVNLTVKNGEASPRAVNITRSKIEVESVTLENRRINEGSEAVYAYLKLTSFTNTTDVEFKSLTRNLLVDQPQGIVLDLRNNPGGVLDTAVNIASQFLKKDSIILFEEKAGAKTPYPVATDGELLDRPLIVLVNGGSASAAEILAGALQDNDRAQVIGSRTFGKGTVQNFIELNNQGSLKLTIARWLTPSGRSIDEAGITPDQEIELTGDDYNSDRDPQLDAAVRQISKKP